MATRRRHETLRSRRYSFTVLFDPVPEGGYQVSVPALPGILTYGRTLREAREMARDALRCHLEALRSEAQPIPRESDILKEKVTVALPI